MNVIYIEHMTGDRWRVIRWDDEGQRVIYDARNRVDALAFASMTAPDEIHFVEPVIPADEVVRGLKEILDGMVEIVG